MIIQVSFINCTPFQRCRTEINDEAEHIIDQAEHINITMPMYSLMEYSDNYFDTSGSLWQFKRDEIIGNINLANKFSSFKYKSNLISNTVAKLVKRRCKNSCIIKIFKQFLEVIRNSVD